MTLNADSLEVTLFLADNAEFLINETEPILGGIVLRMGPKHRDLLPGVRVYMTPNTAHRLSTALAATLEDQSRRREEGKT